MGQKLSSAALVFLVSIGYHQQVRAYEIAGDDAGVVNAGAEASAQAPSTIASNPAGLSYLRGTQILVGAQLVYGRIKFEPDSSTNVSGGGSGNAIEPTLGGSFFISRMLDEDWSIGFGSYVDFGSTLDFKSSWSGRYFSQHESINGLALVPSVAYRINDKWSIGVGIKVMHGVLKEQAAVDRSFLGVKNPPDAQFKYKDSTWGYGANIGVIYELQPGTRVGLAYTSKVNLDFSNHLSIQGGGALLKQADGINVNLKIQVPQTANLSIYHQLDPQWGLLATLGWKDMSQFGDVAIDVDTSLFGAQSTITKSNYKDVYQLALGAQYRATPELLWSMGVAYSTSATSNSNRTLNNPIGSQWCLGTGVTYALNHKTDFNLSWDVIWMGDLPVDQTQVLSNNRTSGEYKNIWFQVLTGNLIWRF
ncbi:OmpP1/FadL family transporter [Pseudomonas sp. NFIX28]|uniref:OmpP1/FadL family transporter n=1 Tax=Pseudomonas sp. NFIX28 TaxID=1566235 RepID=UPI000895ED75|nr:outer membrane protein transport protein [Pseudomonas sp. NFIX28]SDZ68768.1 long-chain fatty acid transport protein [Pseudomonas sp. NFIX28]